VISVGKNNNFGHPHQEVLEYLKQSRVLTMRTDKSGTIVLKE